MRARSIRFRLTAWYAVILSVGLGLFGGLVWFLLRNRLLAEVDHDLSNRAAQFEKYFRAESAEAPPNSLKDELDEFSQGLPTGSSILLRGSDGFTFAYAPKAPTAEVRTLHREFTASGITFELEARAPVDSVLHTLDLLRLLLLGLIPVVIAIACCGGWWLSGRALKPVNDIAAAALTISIENLSGRLPVPDTGDEIARLSQVLNTMLARLEAAVRTLSQFVADASHELRTPLAVIRTSAELALRRPRSAESYRDSLQEVMIEAERMTKLVEDLLILARNDTGAAEMPLVPVDLREIVESVCAEMQGLADLRQLQIETSLPGVAMITGNRPALHRLFLVLLDNALKYSDPGGTVKITLNNATVAIENQGPGISPADLPHIFERFYRADRARTGEGYGLGLSLAESIAKAHGANIEAQSDPTATIFNVIFPPRTALTSAVLAPPVRAGMPFSQS